MLSSWGLSSLQEAAEKAARDASGAAERIKEHAEQQARTLQEVAEKQASAIKDHAHAFESTMLFPGEDEPRRERTSTPARLATGSAHGSASGKEAALLRAAILTCLPAGYELTSPSALAAELQREVSRLKLASGDSARSGELMELTFLRSQLEQLKVQSMVDVRSPEELEKVITAPRAAALGAVNP